MRRLAVIAAAMMAAAVTAAADPLDAAVGKALFARNWVAAPASTKTADGLGPLYNARSCNACHAGGGPARFTAENGALKVRGLVVRSTDGSGHPHTTLGTQIQTEALPGLFAEAKVTAEVRGKDLFVSTELTRQTQGEVLFETRVAPSLQGRAAIDKVDEDAILALADPDDLNGDGISGRPNLVRDANDRMVPGRFGSKAAGTSLLQQSAAAAALDIGLSSPLRPLPHGDCTVTQTTCLAHATGRSVLTQHEEISIDMLSLISTYVATLEARAPDMTSAGFTVFNDGGCTGCHAPQLPDRDGRPVTIFSDLLLHDMGDGDAGAVREGDALPGEWRTAPLRDLDPRNGTRRYLHGGAAATIEEAVLRHGGEAVRVRDAFKQLDGREKQMLLDFLEQL